MAGAPLRAAKSLLRRSARSRPRADVVLSECRRGVQGASREHLGGFFRCSGPARRRYARTAWAGFGSSPLGEARVRRDGLRAPGAAATLFCFARPADDARGPDSDCIPDDDQRRPSRLSHDGGLARRCCGLFEGHGRRADAALERNWTANGLEPQLRLVRRVAVAVVAQARIYSVVASLVGRRLAVAVAAQVFQHPSEVKHAGFPFPFAVGDIEAVLMRRRGVRVTVAGVAVEVAQLVEAELRNPVWFGAWPQRESRVDFCLPGGRRLACRRPNCGAGNRRPAM